ncbi:MAG: tRNA (adenosine(37)-N6)-threonylcarbamoyltransferase complex ATPase subunit type 1 TsaE, partial [Bacteroidales bacterium]|nr:tRNA (adenosine(37)-N6)-threonylcarbamoyltransferase complex ATPase subunit type 1 TsaE [Bacteroidales bacterium]
MNRHITIILTFALMKHTLEIKDLSCLDTAAETFLGMIGDHRLIAFRAAMGAGKTTFISALCRKLGVNADAVSSPTFAIVNEYRGSGSRTIFHFDFYRIENPAE